MITVPRTLVRCFSSDAASLLPILAQYESTPPPIPTQADVVVIGGGHAGVEAAAAAYRALVNQKTTTCDSPVPRRVVLLTQRMDTIGEMACNPAIGGVGKGTLVREVDALDGLMGKAADASGIHFKVLNRSRGPAVQGPRCQCDRTAYKTAIQEALVNLIRDESNPHVTFDVVEASADDVVVGASADTTQPNVVTGVIVTPSVPTIPTSSSSSSSSSSSPPPPPPPPSQTITTSRVVVTTGTFLRGRVHLGRENYPAGRHLENSKDVELPSSALAKTFDRLGLPLSSLNTGTPPRLLGSSINWNHPELEEQPSEMPPELEALSFMTPLLGTNATNVTNATNATTTASGGPALLNINQPFLPTVQTFTNPKTHTKIMEHFDGLPQYSTNKGEGQGPRYCPSLDQKVKRFPHRDRHQIWLEPESEDRNGTIYPNGISMSLHPDIQLDIVRTIAGLENAILVRPGYSVEYEHVDPRVLRSTLEVKEEYANGLYLAGQLNGTTGYEEAAAQGIIAGANAGLSLFNNDGSNTKKSFVIDRTQAFTGVLIDDLTTSGVTEPYRMFSSRSEYRLTLRAENADFRLTEMGANAGLMNINGARACAARERKELVDKGIEHLKNFALSTTEWYRNGIDIVQDGKRICAHDIVGRRKMLTTGQQCTLEDVELVEQNVHALQNITDQSSPIKNAGARVRRSVEVMCTYAPYLDRQAREIKSWRKHSDLSLSGFPFESLKGLIKTEELEKLMEIRPNTIQSASKISGVNASTVVMLLARQQKLQEKKSQQ